MPGTILENLSGRKLSVLVTILLVCQVVCFLIGLIAPSPARTQGMLSTVCVDDHPEKDDFNRWFTRKCPKSINLADKTSTSGLEANNLVFAFQMPLYDLDFSRWQQNLVGILQIDIVYQNDQKIIEPVIEITLEARLAYSDKTPEGGVTPWQFYANAEEKRYMECTFDSSAVIAGEKEGYPYNCTMVPLFELGCLYHDYYLLNLRLPYGVGKNIELGKVEDIYLHLIHMNGGFTKIWVGLKSFFFPVVVGVMCWFWNRVHRLNRTPALLEYVLVSLGGSLAFLNLPLEYLSLNYDMPFMLLLGDIRQGVFYAMLLSFWLIFAGEHMLIQDQGERNTLRMYWRHLSTIATGCLSLLVFDLCERGMQLVNPFYTVWVTPVGTSLALAFIILAGLSASLYFVFLCYMVWRVFRNITLRRAVLPGMSQARRLHYEGIIYRFNFLMLATVLCAAITVVSFVLSQVAEGQNRWDEGMELEVTSAIHTGVYGMWNVYICGMLMLYAPSHKQWPCEGGGGGEGEAVEFSRLPSEGNASEISALTTFAAKSNFE